MLHKTRGIVLNHIKFKESSIIVKIFTEEFGVQSYIVNSIRSAKSKGKIAVFQPFTILDLVVYHQASKGIHRISEYKCIYPFSSIPFDIRKTSMVMFITEVLSKCIQSEESEPELFQFIVDSGLTFDRLKTHFENFHLRFLFQLTYHLGIQPESVDVLYDSIFKDLRIKQEVQLTLLEISVFEELITKEYGEQFEVSSSLRKKFLLVLNDYYRLHIDHFGTLNSIRILNEVFH